MNVYLTILFSCRLFKTILFLVCFLLHQQKTRRLDKDPLVDKKLYGRRNHRLGSVCINRLIAMQMAT